MGRSTSRNGQVRKVIPCDKLLTSRRFDDLEPSVSLYNTVFRLAEKHHKIREILKASEEDTTQLLIDSLLRYCRISRLCGTSGDLLSALAKTGVLEQKFERTRHFQSVLPATLLERAEILWKRNENIEAVETLRSLIRLNKSQELIFSLVSKEVALTTLVQSSTEGG
jgi:hypothetical protein